MSEEPKVVHEWEDWDTSVRSNRGKWRCDGVHIYQQDAAGTFVQMSGPRMSLLIRELACLAEDNRELHLLYDQQNAELADACGERDQLASWNSSVNVCKEHMDDIVGGEVECWVCTAAEYLKMAKTYREQRDELRHVVEKKVQAWEMASAQRDRATDERNRLRERARELEAAALAAYNADPADRQDRMDELLSVASDA